MRRFDDMFLRGAAAVLAFASILGFAPPVSAHCDTLDGPVVAAARRAIDRGDATPVLRWVRPDDEAEIRAAFAQTLAARASGGAARDVADRWFFETLVRVHRAGEGAPFTGLKPAGEVEPIVAAADTALAGGAIDPLVARVTEHIASGIRERYRRAVDTRRRADESVEAGREAVEAYVEYVHYVEGIHVAAAGGARHEHEREER